MKDYIKQLVKIKQTRIHDLFESFFCKDVVKFTKSEKYAFVFLAADYNNLGDIAITTAQVRFLQQIFPTYKIVCAKPSDTIRYCKSIKKLSTNNVLVTIIGGGNNGSLYEFLERPRRFILNELKGYRIVSFPQTVFYGTSERDIPYKYAFIKAANKCSHLNVFARERYSLNKYRELKLEKAKIDLVPDIVFSLVPPRLNDHSGDGIALMLRNDIEKNVDVKHQKQIIDYLTLTKDEKIEKMDTWGESTKLFDDKTLMNYLEKLSHKKIAITDRLHGMIFCFITHTPCIVIDSMNPKILSTYETWLRKQNFIKMINTNSSIQEFISAYESLAKNIKPDAQMQEFNYLPLIEACKGE